MAKIARFDRSGTARDALESVRAKIAERHGSSASDADASVTGASESSLLETGDLRAGVAEKVYEDEPILQVGAHNLKNSRTAAQKPQGHRGQQGLREQQSGRLPLGQRSPQEDERASALREDSAHPRWAQGLRLETPSTPRVEVAPPMPQVAEVALPERYAAARKLPHEQGMVNATPSRVFFEQAKLLADVTDDFEEPQPFFSYYPSYQSMNNAQLRYYVTWRGHVRAGEDQAFSDWACGTYALVYANELLLGIGAAPGADALHALLRLLEMVEKSDASVAAKLRIWAGDYAISQGLDLDTVPWTKTSFSASASSLAVIARAERACLAKLSEQDQRIKKQDFRASALSPGALEQALKRRMPPLEAFDESYSLDPDSQASPFPDQSLAAPSESELFDALVAACTPSIAKSPFFRECRDDVQTVVSGVFARLVRHCALRRKTGLYEGLFGAPWSSTYQMFRSALVPLPFLSASPNAIVHVGGGEFYAHFGTVWYHALISPCATGSPELSRILRAIDARMRAAYGYPKPLQERAIPKYQAKIIDEEIERVLEWRRAHTIPELQIDRTALQGIRTASARTREALLVDEEREDVETELAHTQGTLWSVADDAPEQDSSDLSLSTAPLDASPTASSSVRGEDAQVLVDLTSDELELVRTLLEGGEIPPHPARPGAPTLSLLVDSVNEKLYDFIGDAAIVFSDGSPKLLEDYVDDVRAACGL